MVIGEGKEKYECFLSSLIAFFAFISPSSLACFVEGMANDVSFSQ